MKRKKSLRKMEIAEEENFFYLFIYIFYRLFTQF